MAPVYVWKFDELRGWNLRAGIEASPYHVTFISKPGDDFYHTYFLVTQPDGKTARVTYDGDDYKWWDIHTIEKDGRIYFSRTQTLSDENTPYIEPRAKILSAGQEISLSDLDYQ